MLRAALLALKATLDDYLFPMSAEEETFLVWCAHTPERTVLHANPDGIRYLFPYQTSVGKGAISLIKRAGDPRALRAVTRALVNDMRAQIGAEGQVLHCAVVPSEETHVAEDGYDHAAGLREAVTASCAEAGIESRMLRLISSGKTLRQTEAGSRAARQKNVAGTMTCPDDAAGMTVCIIDDVATTGSTLSEAARAFRARGAKKVIRYAVAWES